MSPSASDGGPVGFVVVGNPGSRRVELFQAALGRLGLPPAQVVAYADLLAGRECLAGAIQPGALVRIELPGKDFEVERALLIAGADAAEAEGCEWIGCAAAERLMFEKGRILPSRQWYLGWCAALRLVERQLAACPAHRLMSAPADIALMFDKCGCHQRLAGAGVPVPRALGPLDSYDQLLDQMRQTGRARVFVKLAHSSSASGVVAYQASRDRHQATTTVEMVRQGGELRLYNSRRIRVYRDQREIAELIEALCRHRVHVEEWLPKAGFANRTFDLRVVVIGGRARHLVARLSRGPMTNLHLLNERGDIDAVLGRIGPVAWEAARQSCERAMRCFGGSLYGGVDLLISADYRRHAILEVNAFGDLLPGVLCDGVDTYAAEILAMLSEKGGV